MIDADSLVDPEQEAGLSAGRRQRSACRSRVRCAQLHDVHVEEPPGIRALMDPGEAVESPIVQLDVHGRRRRRRVRALEPEAESLAVLEAEEIERSARVRGPEVGLIRLQPRHYRRDRESFPRSAGLSSGSKLRDEKPVEAGSWSRRFADGAQERRRTQRQPANSPGESGAVLDVTHIPAHTLERHVMGTLGALAKCCH